MKNMFESKEIFEAYARIDANKFIISKILEKINEKKSPIDEMIDQATGASNKELFSMFDSAITALDQIIADKAIIEADATNEIQLRSNIQDLYKTIDFIEVEQ